MSWSRLEELLSSPGAGADDVALELAQKLERHVHSIPCDFSDDSRSHDEARDLVARALEWLATRGAPPSDEPRWQLYQRVRSGCMYPIHYGAADARDARMIAGLAWLEHHSPDAGNDARQWMRASSAPVPDWLAPALADDPSKRWRALDAQLDDLGGQDAAELLGQLCGLLRGGVPDEIAEDELNRILERAAYRLVPALDPKRDAQVLEDFAERCSYAIEDVVWNEDEPTTDSAKWAMMAVVAYEEVVLGREPHVVDYVRDYMPEPRPEWLTAVLK